MAIRYLKATNFLSGQIFAVFVVKILCILKFAGFLGNLTTCI